MNVIKVSALSRTISVASTIADIVRDHERAEVQAIGVDAVNQAIKAIAIAKGYLSEEDVLIGCSPEFVEVEIADQERTAIHFEVFKRHTETS